MKLIAIACVNLLLLAKAAKQYVATFSADNSGIAGTVTVDNGEVAIELDLSGVVDGGLPTSFSDCTDGGLAYHIHKVWNYNDSDDRIGSDPCSGTYTEGHWDPWHACGAASGNQYCADPVTTLACIPKTAYSPDYSADPFSAEVGDWSSKYGKLTVDATTNMISRTDSSFYEVLPSEMEDLSIVFHCNSGTRAFCAPFEISETASAASVPDQANEKVVVAKFEGLSDDSMIKLAPDGTITVDIDGSSIASSITDCTEFEYSIFEAGTLTESATGDDCSGVTEQYDPTAQCLPWSGNEYCTAGKLCTDSTYSYSCDFSSARYSCAPGDLSGKVGELLDASAAYSKTMAGNTLIPPTDGLIGKVIGINCPYSSSTAIKFLACGIIEEYDADSSVAAVSFIMASIVSFIALLY